MGFPTRLARTIGPVKIVEGMITDNHASCKGMAIIITASWKADSNVSKGLFNLTRNGREMLVCQTFLLYRKLLEGGATCANLIFCELGLCLSIQLFDGDFLTNRIYKNMVYLTVFDYCDTSLTDLPISFLPLCWKDDCSKCPA